MLHRLTGNEIAEAAPRANGQWTPVDVFHRLVEAARVAQVCVNQPGPAAKWTATIETWREAYGDGDNLRTRRKRAAPHEVTLMEEAMLWPLRHVLDDRHRKMLAALVVCRALGGNFRRACKRHSWGKSQAYEIININLRAIAGALNRGKVPVRL